MCKFIKKVKQNHKIRKAKKNCEKAAVMSAKCARTFEHADNQKLADFWWSKYRNLYNAIEAANAML